MKQSKIDIAKKIAEGSAHQAQVAANEAAKCVESARSLAEAAKVEVAEIKGLPDEIRKGFTEQVDALRKQFEEAVTGLLERVENSAKEVDAKVVAATEITEACTQAAEQAEAAAEKAQAMASKAEGSVGHLNELGIKPVEPEPEPLEATPVETPVESPPA